MSQKPTLKLKLTSSGPLAPQSPIATPSTGTPKIKLRFGSSTPKTASLPNLPPTQSPISASKSPAEAKKPGRKPKKDRPAKLATPKKRDFATHSEDEGPDTGASSSRPLIKKLKLTARAPTTPFIRMKAKGKPPHRPLGVGYDSEASDREIDPAIEEGFILRMQPGEDCEYLRKAVEDKRWGPRSEGGADVRMKFLTRDGRRAVVTIKGRHYAASLVDLPCIVEGMKSWDRRGWWKSADICQMLLVLGRINKEDDALEYALPARDVDNWSFAHGLTPPMRWVRRRRFRKRIDNKKIERIEEEVERLLKEDDDADGSKYDILDLDRLSKEQSAIPASEDGAYGLLGNAGMNGDGDEQDAEGDMDEGPSYFEGADQDDDGLEADLEMAMMESDNEGSHDDAPIDTGASVSTPALIDTATNAGTPASTSAAPTPSREDTGDDESSDEDEEDNAEDEIDEDALEQQQDLQRQREEIADLDGAIRGQTAELDKQTNPILRTKIMKKIQSLKGDLELKKAAIGESGDD
ncbi:hypothetical protein MMC09_002837 [Bachmanniomyces sp. S44760]|nr:hypothetical protein [Bachmanniomyces sp. S44760]